MRGAEMPQGMDSSSTDQTGIVPDLPNGFQPDGSELGGAEAPTDQTDRSDVPAAEEMQPVVGGVPHGADGIQDEQMHDPAVQSGDLQTERMVPGAQIPSAEKEAGGSGIVAQQTEDGEQLISAPIGEQGSMASHTPAADAQFSDTAAVPFGGDPQSAEVNAAVGEATAQMPNGDGVVPEQTDTGIASAPVAGQLQGDDLQGAGESDASFGEHDSAVPAEQPLEVPQNGSGASSDLAVQPPIHDADSEGTGTPGSVTAENGGDPVKEGGLDAGHTEVTIVPGTNIHAEMPAFTSDPIGVSDAIAAGESGIENKGESQVHVPGFSGSESGGAEIPNESGDASVQTQMPEAHDILTGTAEITNLVKRSVRNGLVEITIKAYNQKGELVLVDVTEAIVKCRICNTSDS